MEERGQAAAVPKADSLRELALQIYIELAGRVYAEPATPDRPRPQPQMLAQMSFKLAEAFETADLKVNPTAIAARDAATKAGVKLSDVEMDFEKLSAAR